jgi:hypothetical protein
MANWASGSESSNSSALEIDRNLLFYAQREFLLFEA